MQNLVELREGENIANLSIVTVLLWAVFFLNCSDNARTKVETVRTDCLDK